MTLAQFPTWALSSKVVVHGHCFVTLPFTINETLKWHSSLPILMQDSFWWWQCSVRYIFPPPASFWDFSPHQYLSGDNSVLNKSDKQSQYSSGDNSVLNGWLVTGFLTSRQLHRVTSGQSNSVISKHTFQNYSQKITLSLSQSNPQNQSLHKYKYT